MRKGRFGPFRILGDLGSGASAVVYRAEVVEEVRNLRPGDRVALKILQPHFTPGSQTHERFRREIQIGQGIEHANVIRILDAGTAWSDDTERLYLAMEHLRGQTLRALIDEGGAQPEALCRHLGREIASGLAALHARGVVHRDLKPENIFVTDHNEVKVMDLGVARLLEGSSGFTQVGRFIGSILYAAPEQFSGAPSDVDTRADLYALGWILYELATGQHPFRRNTFGEVMALQLDAVPPRPRTFVPRLSPFFDACIATLLEKSASARMDTATQVIDSLDKGEASAWWAAQEVRRQEARRPRFVRTPVLAETSLHGREKELESLDRLWSEVRKGRGQVALVRGEAGIGKTRLVQEFVAGVEARGEDVNVLYGAASPGSATTISGAFSSAWREFFGSTRIEAALRPYLAEAPGLAPRLAAFLHGVPPTDATDAPSFTMLEDAFTLSAHALATERPTVIVIDDLHFAPAESLALFETMAGRIGHHRLLLIGTARNGLDPTWTSTLQRRADAHLIDVTRLSAEAVMRLLIDALGSSGIARTLTAPLAHRTEGNPYFLLEILKAQQQKGTLARGTDGTWALRGKIEDLEAPVAVQDLIRARLAGLGEADRELLDVAAVCGYEFDPLLVARVLERARIPVLKDFGRLERENRLVHPRGRVFFFDHRQIRETLQEALSPLLRKEVHAALGRAIEERMAAGETTPAQEGRDAAQACDHFLRANRGGAALQHLDDALAELDHSGVPRHALDLLDRVLAVPGLVVDDRRANVLLLKADRQARIGAWKDREAVVEEARQAAASSSDPILRGRVRLSQGAQLQATGNVESALASYRDALRLFRQAEDPHQEARIHGNIGTALMDAGRFEEAVESHRRHLEMAEALGDDLAAASARGNLGNTLVAMGRYGEAVEEMRRALSVFEVRGTPYLECKLTLCLGRACGLMGHPLEARPWYERTLVLARRIGYRGGIAKALGNLGIIESALGHLRLALEHLEADLALEREMGNTEGETLALNALAYVEGSLGRMDRAREHLARAGSLAHRQGHRVMEREIWAALGSVESQASRPAVALEAYARARELLDPSGEEASRAALDDMVADVWVQQGRVEDARKARQAALLEIRKDGDPASVCEAETHLAALHGLDAAEAAAHLETAAPNLPHLTRMACAFALWRATGEASYLRRAHDALDHLCENAPEDARETTRRGVRSHRQIEEAYQALRESERPTSAG